jgi:hypothetical protein
MENESDARLVNTRMKRVRMRTRTKAQKNPPEELKSAFFNEDGSPRQPGQTPNRFSQKQDNSGQNRIGIRTTKNVGLCARGAKSWARMMMTNSRPEIG